jgi:hypothetical protein
MPYSVDEIIKAYEILVKGIEAEATDDDERAFGGIIRAGKGKLVESIAKHMVEIAWKNINGKPKRLSLEKQTYKVPINKPYINRIKYKEVREYILNHIDEYYYGLKTDIHVSIDGKMVMGIECKAYTENAMLKRIMVDFTLLKSVVPDINCVLIQLESQLTGDYSNPCKKIIYGSHSTHTIMSYFDVDLNIITLLEGERKVDEPIHTSKHYKELKRDMLILAINSMSELLKKFL